MADRPRLWVASLTPTEVDPVLVVVGEGAPGFAATAPGAFSLLRRLGWKVTPAVRALTVDENAVVLVTPKETSENIGKLSRMARAIVAEVVGAARPLSFDVTLAPVVDPPAVQPELRRIPESALDLFFPKGRPAHKEEVARALSLIGRPERAAVILEQLTTESNEPRVQFLFGDLLVQQLNRPEEGLAVLDAASRGAPQQPAIHAARGRALLKLGRPKEAVAAFEVAATLDQTEWVSVAHAAISAGDLDKARKAAGRALNAGDPVHARLLLALVAKRKGDVEGAKVQLEEVDEVLRGKPLPPALEELRKEATP